MKKSLCLATVGFFAAVCLPISSAKADQWDITVPDASFDDHELTFGDYIYISDAAYTGAWKPDVVEGAYVDYGYWSADGDLPALSGNNKIYGGDVPDYIYQILDETFIEGETYTLSVWVGRLRPRLVALLYRRRLY